MIREGKEKMEEKEMYYNTTGGASMIVVPGRDYWKGYSTLHKEQFYFVDFTTWSKWHH